MIRALVAAFALLIASPALAAPKQLPDLAYGADPEQKLDVYVPEQGAKNAPIIFMVHGGAWRFGDKRDEESATYKAPYFTSKGYVFVSINYRMKNNASPLLQMYDVGDALKFVEAKAAEWGADPKRIVIMGHSSGGHLVGLVATVPPELKYPLKGSVFLDSAGFDISYIMQKPHLDFYDQVFGKDAKSWETNSPLHHLSQKSAPMLLICTPQSPFCQNADAFEAKAKQFGTQVERFSVDRNHQQVNMDVGQPGGYTDKIEKFIASVI